MNWLDEIITGFNNVIELLNEIVTFIFDTLEAVFSAIIFLITSVTNFIGFTGILPDFLGACLILVATFGVIKFIAGR